MQHLSQYPVFIQASFLIICIAFAGIVLSIITMILFRFTWRRLRKREAFYTNQIENLLTNEVVINEQLHAGMPVEQVVLALTAFRALPLDKQWCRHLLVQRILYYRSILSGNTADLLRKLYIDLGLHKRAMHEVNSTSPRSLVRGLNELCMMDMPVDKELLLMLAVHSNRNVMEMARCACVKLLKNPFCFFKEVRAPILPWEKLELLRMVSLRKDVTVPSFAHWISNRYHRDVISFSMRAAACYQQFDAIPLLLGMLNSEDSLLKTDAVNALGKLMAQEAEHPLVSMYASQPEPVKLEILKALGRIGSGHCLAFLEQEFMQSEDFEVRKNSARSIIRHKALAKALVRHLTDDTIGLSHLIMLHGNNPLIRN